MKRVFSVLALGALAACGGGGETSVSTSSAPGAGGVSAAPNVPSVPTDTSFAGMLNNVRAANGAGAVAYDARLGAAAQGHANDMLANNYFSHTGLNGSTAGQRITAAGYNWRTYGENIARGQTSEAQVLEGWQNSAGHRRNNLNPAFEDFALAKAGSGSSTRWVLVLATEQ